MKLVRFDDAGTPRFGRLHNGIIQPLTGEFPHFAASEETAVPLGTARLLTPVNPGKIVAVGPNYRAHLIGRPLPDRPFLWIKPQSTLTHPGDPIVLPAALMRTTSINHESELAIVIGRTTRNVAPEDALACVFGYTIINDVTAGEMDDKPAFRSSAIFVDGKIFDSFAPLGPWIETQLEVSDLRIRCSVNQTIRQDHRTSDMIWPCDELISRISKVMTLNPGDVIATGSPPGVKPLKPGDRVEIEIDGIGILSNPVVLDID